MISKHASKLHAFTDTVTQWLEDQWESVSGYRLRQLHTAVTALDFLNNEWDAQREVLKGQHEALTQAQLEAKVEEDYPQTFRGMKGAPSPLEWYHLINGLVSHEGKDGEIHILKKKIVLGDYMSWSRFVFWMMVALGRETSTKDHTRFVTTCGTIHCVNPSHLKLRSTRLPPKGKPSIAVEDRVISSPRTRASKIIPATQKELNAVPEEKRKLIVRKGREYVLNEDFNSENFPRTCEISRKVGYPSKEIASQAVHYQRTLRIGSKISPKKIRAYECASPFCHQWHITTHQRKK